MRTCRSLGKSPSARTNTRRTPSTPENQVLRCLTRSSRARAAICSPMAACLAQRSRLRSMRVCLAAYSSQYTLYQSPGSTVWLPSRAEHFHESNRPQETRMPHRTVISTTWLAARQAGHCEGHPTQNCCCEASLNDGSAQSTFTLRNPENT